MFILYGLALGLAVGLLARGRVAGLANLQFRWAPLVLLGFAAQLLLFSDAVAARVGDLGPPLYVASTAAVVVAVVRNARIPGMIIVAAGAVCNLAAIVANGGYMPTTAEAMDQLGRSAATLYSNSAIMPTAALALLTDLFAMPRWMPFANVYSIGDVLIAVGVAVTVVSAMRGGQRHRTTEAGGAHAH